MAKSKTEKTREEAQEKIASLMVAVEELYISAQKIADRTGVSFYSYDPAQRSTQYYPKRPDDWKVWNEWDPEDGEEDPNEAHPEHENYHPWNEGGENEYDWSKGHWISSSERC